MSVECVEACVDCDTIIPEGEEHVCPVKPQENMEAALEQVCAEAREDTAPLNPAGVSDDVVNALVESYQRNQTLTEFVAASPSAGAHVTPQVALLRDMLARAEAGKLQAVSLFWVDDQKSPGMATAGDWEGATK